MIRVEVYGKPDCPLCDEAAAVAEELRRELPFELVEVDVTLDPSAERAYREKVPVVFVDGQRASAGRVPSAPDLRRLIGRALDLAEGSAAGESAPLSPRASRAVKTAFAAVALAALPALLGAKAWDVWVARPRLAERTFDIARADAAAPDFQLQAADGQSTSLAAHRGKVLFVNFWATWCPPCRDELPSMLSLGREIEARHPGRFKMVAISVDDGWDVIRDFFGGPPPPGLTVALDTEQLTTRAYYCAARGACPESYKFPESYIVDQTGRLVAYVVGPRNWSDPAARRFLERLIDG